MRTRYKALIGVTIGGLVLHKLFSETEKMAQNLARPGMNGYRDIVAELRNGGLGCDDGVGCAPQLGSIFNDANLYKKMAWGNLPRGVEVKRERERNRYHPTSDPTRSPPIIAQPPSPKSAKIPRGTRAPIGGAQAPIFNRPIAVAGRNVGRGPHFARGGRGWNGWGGRGWNGWGNDMNGMGDVSGLGGFKFKRFFAAPIKAVKKVIAPAHKQVKKVTNKVTNVVKRDLSKVTDTLKRDYRTGKKLITRDMRGFIKPVKSAFKQSVRDLKNFTKPVIRDFTNAMTLLRLKDPLFKKLAPIKPRVEYDNAGTPIYLDENGNEITQAEYQRLQAESAAWNVMIAAMEASALGEVQYEQATDTFWCQDSGGAWWSWNKTTSVWIPFKEEPKDDPYNGTGIIPLVVDYESDMQPNAVNDYSEPTWDDDTGKWWQQEATGAWWYFDSNANAWAQESSTAASDNYDPNSVYDDADYLRSLTAQDAGATGIWDEGTNKYWTQDETGVWWWWSDVANAWQPDVVVDSVVMERQSGHTDANRGFLAWLFDWGDGGLGYLTNRETGNRLFVLRQLGDTVAEIPIKADKNGVIYADNGGTLGCMGCVDDLAGPGLGLTIFGRSYGRSRDNVERIAKEVASYTSPGSALYKYVKTKQPKIYREYRKGWHDAAPYVMIVGGVVLSVASLSLASPAGAAMVAGGVANLAAQGYTDYSKRETRKDAEEEERNWQVQDDAARARALESAGESAVSSDALLPTFGDLFDWNWWTGNSGSSYYDQG